MSKFMRMIVFFDLPVQTKTERRHATAFRNFLLKDGYHMLQFSVYARVCNGNDAVKKHESRLRASLPPNGSIRLSLDGALNPRDAFGSHDDADHVYNTPRGWYMLRYFNPNTFAWDGPDADFTPRSDDLPWCMVPEKKITPEDVKYVLSSHYQGTPYDPYAATASEKGIYRPIGVNRNDFMALLQMRPDVPEDFRAVEWLAFASNAFNTMVPFYANVDTTPEYLSNTTGDVSTDNFYWASRLLAAMADASYAKSVFHIERYTLSVGSKANGIINTYDDAQRGEADPAARAALRAKANEELAAMVRAETTDALNKVLFELSSGMKNAYSRSDA